MVKKTYYEASSVIEPEAIAQPLSQTGDRPRTPLQILLLHPSLEVKGGITTVLELILQEAPAEMQIQGIETHIEGSVWDRFKIYARAVLKLIPTLITQPVDVVYIHVSQRGSAFRKAILCLIATLFHKPVVMHTHGSQFREFYGNLSPLLRAFIRFAFQQPQRFIVLADRWKAFYVEQLGLQPERVVVLPNPVRLPEAVPDRSTPDPVTVLFLGRLGQRKGAFDLIQAFAQLPEASRQRAHLIVAGDGEVAAAQQLVDSLGLQEQIMLPGWIAGAKRDQLLAAADVFVLPSYNEGLPMAVLEAMGWGLPVITTPVGGIPDLITSEQNGLLVQPGVVEQLSTALQRLIDSEALRRSLGAAGRSHVVPLDIHQYCVTLLNIQRAAASRQ